MRVAVFHLEASAVLPEQHQTEGVRSRVVPFRGCRPQEFGDGGICVSQVFRASSTLRLVSKLDK